MRYPTLELRIDGITADELFAEWQAWSVCCAEIRAQIMNLLDRWRQTADPDAKGRLIAEFDDIRPQYETVCAWAELFHSAGVFSRNGGESEFSLPGASSRMTIRITTT